MTPSITLTSPEYLIASLPYLLGFEPRESAVAVWLGDGRIVVTQRLDLPADPDDDQWHRLLWSHAGVPQADALIVVLVSSRTDLTAISGPILATAESADVQVLDIVVTDAGRWTSLLCDEESCCPASGRPIAAETRLAVSAEFAWVGVATMGERADLVAALARDAAAVPLVERELADGAHEPAAGDLEQWRDEAIARVIRLLQGRVDPIVPATVAATVTALADIRVRDTVLWTASHWRGQRLAGAQEALGGVVRAAPAGYLAPAGSLYAALAWLGGDGARANIVLERVLGESPDYSLAQLLAAAVVGGLHPDAWRAAMQSLTRIECRHGAASV